MSKQAKVLIGSHFIKVYDHDDKIRWLLKTFLSQHLIGKIMVKRHGRWFQENGKVYAYIEPDKTGITFHINLKDKLFQLFQQFGITEDRLDIQEAGFEHYGIGKSNYKVKPKFVLRDYQDEVFEEVLRPGHRKVIALNTGYGKTCTALKCAEALKQRFAITVLPRYVDKWIEDVVDYGMNAGTIDPKDKSNKWLVLDKTEKLVKYLDWMRNHPGEDDQDVWVIIIPITTLRQYYKLYAKYAEGKTQTADDMVHPADIWSVMRVGLRITDESHEHFHQNFMIDLHTHLPKSIYLSATLDPSGGFEAKMYEIMFPHAERMGWQYYTPYIDVYAYHYGHRLPESINTIRRDAYSHTLYESNFIEYGDFSKELRERYFKMIYDILKEHYLDIKQDKQKAIIFFSTVEMCTLFVAYLRSMITGYDIRRYVSEDEYEDIMTADIAVSTPGSAGTALDIYGLITNIMTISLRSKQLNLQIMGRTRMLHAWPGQHPRFIYLVADDVDKSVEYHFAKKELLQDRALSHRDIDSGVLI